MKNLKDLNMREFGELFDRNIILNVDKRSIFFVTKDESTLIMDDTETIDSLMDLLKKWRTDLENTDKHR